MKAEARFDVCEVEIKNPANRRLMRGDMSELDAEAFIKMAVMRRGVSTHCFVMEPTSPPPEAPPKVRTPQTPETP